MPNTAYTTPVPIGNVTVHDSFFSNLMKITVEKLLPYQWRALNDEIPDAEPSYCIRNFRAAAGLEQAEHGGRVFQDSDLAKWIEAAAYSLVWHPDAELEKTVDEAIELVEKAQLPDGYIDTYYILNGIENRWTNTKDNHEMYCAGHMLEAAVAYYLATGKRRLLDVMVRCVEHIASVVGPEEGKRRTYPGHEVLEMALCKLYEVTKDEAHLKLARYFIDERGQAPSYFVAEGDRTGHPVRAPFDLRYYQADRPVREQDKAEGHAVRAGYLYSGMADLARLTGDEALAEACRRIWHNITRRQMYITGSVGQSATAESFSYDYDLPNDLIYGETCAAIALAFFAQRMLRLAPRGEYGDVLERVLYNGSISGMSLDGTKFFYVNPLEVDPARCAGNYQFRHVKPERQKWFGCACCPPNLGRLMASLPGYLYHTRGNTLYAVLYTTSEGTAALESGTAKVSMKTSYPWDGMICLRVHQAPRDMTLALRLPGWCSEYTLTVNGEKAEPTLEDGFLYLCRDWQEEDEVVLTLSMPAVLVRANPRVTADIGKVAVQRGPVVYCLEEPDNGPGLQRIYLDRSAVSALHQGAGTIFTCHYEPETLGGIVALEAEGLELTIPDWDEDALYAADQEPVFRPRHLRFIPYYAWANRGPAEMTVWVREKQ